MTDHDKKQKELTELNDDSNENKSQETELSKKEEILSFTDKTCVFLD